MNWLKGLLAAALSGGASTASAMVMDPDHFNTANLKHLGMVAGIGAVMGTVGYLKQSPLPKGTVADPTQAIDPKRFAGTMMLVLALTLPVIACTKPDVPTLLQWAQWGIDGDCKFGAGALAADVCTFGGDAIQAAQAAYVKDPAHGVKAVKQILVDAETRQPKIAPYIDWLVTKL